MKIKVKIEITYMSGAGNLFSVIDNRKYGFKHRQLVKLAPELCQFMNEKTDGLLVINQNESYAFQSDFYNPDGSFGAMCGNGARCAIEYSNKNKIFKINSVSGDISFFMCGREYNGRYHGENIVIEFPPPIKLQPQISVRIINSVINGSYVDVGSKHLVVNIFKQSQWKVIQMNDFELLQIVPKYRYHPQFAPDGVNFNIYEVKESNTIILRTYEKGVEGETGACGTGAIATALTSAANNEVKFPVKIIPTSKIPLIVNIRGNINSIENISLEGPAEFISNNEIEIPDFNE
ncbi:MAG: diaminopimelate epimerase [Ignavibacteria bacterium GWA2_35_8]|nr:MAG: diaminopimelate epimerase [Ignavibacteria bacterium GWA2_35_8]